MVEVVVSVGEVLGWPMPGADAAAVRVVAVRVAGLAAELGRLRVVLSGSLGREVGWAGAAELAFQESVAVEVGRLGLVVQRYEGYAAALGGYARELECWEPVLRAARSRLGAGADPAVVVEFERCWREWDSARRRCVAGLVVAGRWDADRPRHGWSGLVSGVWHGVGLAELSRTLGELGQALVVAGVVLALVCPPAAGAVWAAVAVVAACQLAVDLARRERGERVGLATVGMDALGALPIGRLSVHTAAEADAAIHQLAPELRQSRLVPGGGLAAHEGTPTHRGHTLLKHVGKTPNELAARFETEPHLDWSSSFTDRQTAEAVLAKVLDDHQTAIVKWLASPDQALRLKSDLGVEIGKSVAEDGTIVSAPKCWVVLRKENTMLGYYIRTAFPTR